MNNGDDDVEEEEDEAEWMNSFIEASAPAGAIPATCGSSPSPKLKQRVVLHFDLDCFYAQVEMLRNPALRNVPLGVQQKYIIVTCNYVARELGVKKLMSITDAKEKCPQLVMVNGEDLTNYRALSYKVTELLTSFYPLVERLGFDENFVDVTEMVEKMLAESEESNISFKGHVYSVNDADTDGSKHPSLALGSHIAAQLREAIHQELGLTGCAGVSTNKLLAKLVSGTFKPNQQTTLLPENTGDIMASLNSLRRVPGVGHQTAKRLRTLGLVSVKDLQLFPLADLAREFGGLSARRLKDLAEGIDNSAVTPSGAPQSLSVEDSFKKISSIKEVTGKIQELLDSLVKRMQEDGRQPQTFRLTIRRYSAVNKWFSRESRQCPIQNHVGQKITSGCSNDAVINLVPLAVKLFHKMVDTNASFHLTLINVCFSNLLTAAGTKSSIMSFFSQSLRRTQIHSSQADSSRCGQTPCTDNHFSAMNTRLLAQEAAKCPCSSEPTSCPFKRTQSVSVPAEDGALPRVSCSTMRSDPDEQIKNVTQRLPPHVDPEVFRVLPADIQEELLSFKDANDFREASQSAVSDDTSENSSASQLAPQSSPGFREESVEESSRTTSVHNLRLPGKSVSPGASRTEEAMLSFPWSSDCDFPLNVDPGVFLELPSDVQRELMSEWKQRKPLLKTPSVRKSGKSSLSKDRKSAGKNHQSNNLLNYFKPN